MSEVWAHDLLRQIMRHKDVPGRLKSRIRAGLRPTEVDYRGVRMLVHPSDNNTEFQIWKLGRTHEEKPLRIILDRLSGRRIFAFDVGANAGSFATRLAVAGAPGSVIHAFEPNPVMRSRLVRNRDLNGMSGIEVHECAISDAPGTTALFLPEGNFGLARLYEPHDGGRQIDVPVRCLAEFVPEAGQQVDFLKADVEGFEDRVIVPYLETAEATHHPGLIFFEHKHDGNWTLDLPGALKQHGYRLIGEFGRNALYELARR